MRLDLWKYRRITREEARIHHVEDEITTRDINGTPITFYPFILVDDTRNLALFNKNNTLYITWSPPPPEDMGHFSDTYWEHLENGAPSYEVRKFL